MEKKLMFGLLVMVFIFASAQICSASSVVPVDLKKMSEKAEHVFYGKCTDVNVIEDELGLVSTEVTYEIFRAVKGDYLKDHITFKVFGDASGESEDEMATLIGMTLFQPGREDVLFLYEESPWGFTSPIGLWQGNFPVVQENGRSKLVKSARSFQTTFSGGAKAASGISRRIETPDDLLDEVERIIN